MIKINENALQDFLGITKYLTIDEIKDEVKDYIDLNFAIHDEEHFNKVYTAFVDQIYLQDIEYNKINK
jgi:hypothetical protein